MHIQPQDKGQGTSARFLGQSIAGASRHPVREDSQGRGQVRAQTGPLVESELATDLAVSAAWQIRNPTSRNSLKGPCHLDLFCK